MNTTNTQKTMFLDFPMWTWIALRTICLQLAMWAWIALRTTSLPPAMWAWFALHTICLQLAMWAWFALFTLCLQLAMWAWTANSAHVSPLSVWTKNALLSSRSNVHFQISIGGHSTLFLQQSPLLLATDLVASIRVKFLELTNERFEQLQSWLNLGII